MAEAKAPSADDTAPPIAAPAPKATSAEALDILRQEAAYEAQQRARDANRLETQPDLGLLGAAPWPSKPENAAMPSDPADRKDTSRSGNERAGTFPDIEDISASLDPIRTARKGQGLSDTPVSVPPTSAERNQSFIRGLLLPLVVALILVGLYLLAPIIGSAIPAVAPLTSGYVDAVDGLRLAVAGLLGM